MLVRMNVRCIPGHRPGEMFDVSEDQAGPLIERGFLTSMELWEDRAAAEKVDDPWPEESNA
jgi:hypothetical protein